jgi:hypothetical protein
MSRSMEPANGSDRASLCEILRELLFSALELIGIRAEPLMSTTSIGSPQPGEFM